MSTLERSLIEYVARAAGVPAHDIGLGTQLFSAGLLDSMSVLDLTLFIEREAGIPIPVADVSMQNFDSIERILGYVASRAGRS